MRTRYSRRIDRDTVEHFDSKEAYAQTVTRERQEGIKATLAFLGFLFGGFVSYSFLHYSSLDTAHWPKVIRLLIVLVAAGASSYLLGRFALRIAALLQMLFGLVILFGVASLIWHFI
ncbi:MAG TPA: hypothetical protein VFW68_05905 [Rhodocyclaceae bacterium]|nr:hypothetical protein [Rhodocyclaceae bacterium]